MSLRSDEMASQSMVEKNKRSGENIRSGLKTAASIGTVALGAGLSAKILPFLSEYLTPELALKGLKKVSPKLGNFLEKGVNQGLELKEGIDFLKQNISPAQQQPKQNQNIIGQYSPELLQFMEQEIAQGTQPIHAAAIAQNDPKFAKVIAKLSKDYKTPWSSIVEQVFGLQPKAIQPQVEPQQQAPQQQGNSDQMLMAALQKILEM